MCMCARTKKKAHPTRAARHFSTPRPGVKHGWRARHHRVDRDDDGVSPNAHDDADDDDDADDATVGARVGVDDGCGETIDVEECVNGTTTAGV